MRQIGNFLLMTVSFFAFSVSGQETGTLTVTSNPPGCWVRIDSVLIGKTPLSQFQLEEGTHTVQVFPPANGLWHLEEQVHSVNVIANIDVELSTIFDQPIFINSIPYGAELFSDTTHLGFTPLYIPFTPNEGKQFRIEKSGYIPFLFTLHNRKSILAKLERSEDYDEKVEDPQLLGFMSRKHAKRKFTLLALTVATHWASFYFKNAADRNFERYEAAANPSDSDYYWDETQKYDTLSEVSLGVSYASLAGLIYMVVRQ